MVTFATKNGSPCLPDPLIRAVTENAHRRADYVAAGLRATGLFDLEPPKLPAAFLLELSAVIELGVWEHRGLRQYLDVDLPTYYEASQQLAARCRKGLREFAGPDAAPLSREVLIVWVEHFAWDGVDMLDTDIIVGDTDGDAFVEAIAEFIWNNRDALQHLLYEEYENEQQK